MLTGFQNLVQRIMKDEDEDAGIFNQAKSFFKDSWIEIPDKSSASRMMRPRFVSRDAVSRDTKDDDAQKQDAEEISMKNANDEKESGMEEGGSIDLKVDDVADGTKSADQEQKEILNEEAPTPAVAATAIYVSMHECHISCHYLTNFDRSHIFHTPSSVQKVWQSLPRSRGHQGKGQQELRM